MSDISNLILESSMASFNLSPCMSDILAAQSRFLDDFKEKVAEERRLDPSLGGAVAGQV